MVPLDSPGSAFEAKVLAARLGSEGILWELRGGIDGMYPVGRIEVLVDERDLERAREILLADAIDEIFAENDDTKSERLERWAVVAIVVVAALFLVVRVLGGV
jgi:hypothetical protein